MNSLGFKLAALAIGLALGLGAIELALRMLGAGERPGDLRGLHEAPAGVPWIYGLRPHAKLEVRGSGDVTYEINADGFRDRTYVRPKPDNSFRIIVLGDSLAFGFGVDERQSFPKELEAILSSCGADRDIEVLNFGVGGYNAYNEWAQLAARGGEYEPDLVVVQFCINDLNDPTRHFDTHTSLALGELPREVFPNPEARLTPPPPHSALRGFCDEWRTCRVLAQLWTPDPRARQDSVELAATFAVRDDPKFEAEWAWLADRYADIGQVAEGFGAKLVVAVFPYRGQVGRDGPESMSEQHRKLGEQGGWMVLDLLPAFREEAARRPDEEAPLHLDLWHPNARGHQVAGATIARELIAAGLLPIEDADACELLNR